MRHSANKYLGFIQEPLQEFNIQGSSKNFFKDQPKHFRNLGFPTAMETKSKKYQGKISNPLLGLEFDNKETYGTIYSEQLL